MRGSWDVQERTSLPVITVYSRDLHAFPYVVHISQRAAHNMTSRFFPCLHQRFLAMAVILMEHLMVMLHFFARIEIQYTHSIWNITKDSLLSLN